MPSRKRNEAPDVTDVTDATEISDAATETASEAAAIGAEAMNEAAQRWTSVYEAATRSAFDNIEQATNAWIEMQSMFWLWPLRVWSPGSPLAPASADETNGPGADWFGKFFAGTTPPQPIQESARELMTLGMRSWSTMWAPWTMWNAASTAPMPWRTTPASS
ncbi:hypothetical protein M8A51_09105 [Schlegelella sp. S2-27]|uniref:Phasin protein n=1 Tax=Caldimonas mangrovi TaxID=2944811 RepID=A0ABT0YLT2_9BURK|nr:hypothetical protein [Caldimonas mangrovi]MCM5679691.1 hypothetical protein [Caldimonas mangrovi]